MNINPKVKAGAGVAGAITILVVALFAGFGVDLSDELVQALAIIVAAALPVVAGYLKRA